MQRESITFDAKSNWGQKHLHGLHWGISVIQDDRYRIQRRDWGGSCERLHNQNLDLVGDKPIVVFGNVWCHKDPEEAQRFHHPREYTARNIRWFYWDNPLPHLLYQGAWNTEGHKNWLRLVEGNTMRTHLTPTRRGQHTQRVRDQLRELTRGTHTDWRDIVGPRRPVLPRGRRVLICPSGGHTMQAYYGWHKPTWIQDRIRECEQLGLEWQLRDKPSRGAREVNHNRLYQQLQSQDYFATISCHSMVAIESLLAGVPAIADGVHSAIWPRPPEQADGHRGGACELPLISRLTLTTQEWLHWKGAVQCPSDSEVDAWVEQILLDCYHKRDVYNGNWYHT